MLTKKYLASFPICLMSFIDYMSIGLVYPMFSTMLVGGEGPFLTATTSHALRCLWLGVILALMPLAQFFSGPILGTLSDYKGRKKVMLLSIVFGIVGYGIALIGVWYASIFLLALSRIVIGISSGNEAVGSAAIADLSSAEERTKLFGVMNMAGGFGFTVGPLLGGKLAGMGFGYATPFLFASILCIINLITVIFWFRETCVTIGKRSAFSFGLEHVKKVWNVPGILLLLGIIFFYNFGYSFYWEFVPVFWITTYKFGVDMVGNRLALGAAVYAMSTGLLTPFLAARFRVERILFCTFLSGALWLALPLFFATPWLFWGYIPLQESTIALIFPALSTFVSNKFSADVQGEVMGIYQAVRALALVVSPLIAGVLLGFSVKMPMIVGAASFVAAVFLLVALDSFGPHGPVHKLR